MKQFENKTVLLTGGTGSWGRGAVEKILKQNPKQIRILSRNEFNQVQMEREYNNPVLKFIIGDVRDYEKVLSASKGVDYVIHLSALKHVPICEDFPYEACKTNVDGTKNIINASIANHVEKVIDVSSDKACAPTNVYGATKFIAERLILHANDQTDCTSFQCIRGGNVLGTAGSVVPLFINQIKTNNEVTITDKRMTRYFITVPEAIDLVFTAIKARVTNGLFVINMPSCRIIDLAEVLIEHYGNADTKIKEIGIRPGEKLHEILISKTEAINSYVYNKKYYLICPASESGLDLEKVKFDEYTSATNLMTKQEIKELLNKGGFLL